MRWEPRPNPPSPRRPGESWARFGLFHGTSERIPGIIPGEIPENTPREPSRNPRTPHQEPRPSPHSEPHSEFRTTPALGSIPHSVVRPCLSASGGSGSCSMSISAAFGPGLRVPSRMYLTMRSPSPVAATSVLRGTWRSSGRTTTSHQLAPGSGYDSRTYPARMPDLSSCGTLLAAGDHGPVKISSQHLHARLTVEGLAKASHFLVRKRHRGGWDSTDRADFQESDIGSAERFPEAS